MMKKYVTLIVFVMFVFISNIAIAQCPPGSPPGCPPNPPGLPIDGGIGILLAVGLGYAVHKLKEKK